MGDETSSGRLKISKAHAQLSTIRIREAFVRDKYGTSAVARLREAMSPRLRAALGSGAADDSFADFGLFVEMNVTIDRLFGSGTYELAREMGHYGARHNSGVWAPLFKSGVDVPKFVEIARGLWHKHYDAGRLETDRMSPTCARILLHDFPTPHRTHCLSVVGWLEGVFESCPGTSVMVSKISCRALRGSVCETRVTWRVTKLM